MDSSIIIPISHLTKKTCRTAPGQRAGAAPAQFRTAQSAVRALSPGQLGATLPSISAFFASSVAARSAAFPVSCRFGLPGARLNLLTRLIRLARLIRLDIRPAISASRHRFPTCERMRASVGCFHGDSIDDGAHAAADLLLDVTLPPQLPLVRFFIGLPLLVVF